MQKPEILRQLNNNKKSKSLIYCIDITLKNNRVLHLTTNSSTININGVIYSPNSGLEIEEIYFTDFGNNHILISGIYENGGIEFHTDLVDSSFSVNFYLDGSLHNIVTYTCSEFSRSDLDFLIRVESQIHKYNKKAALLFSKTCRATLGDSKCKINLDNFANYYNITKIDGKKIYISLESFGGDSHINQNGYFSFGKAIFSTNPGQGEDTQDVYFITLHSGNEIFLGKSVAQIFANNTNVKLVPGCDKKFMTCCKKFDNALNFRGEPFVPEFHKLKN